MGIIANSAPILLGALQLRLLDDKSCLYSPDRKNVQFISFRHKKEHRDPLSTGVFYYCER